MGIWVLRKDGRFTGGYGWVLDQSVAMNYVWPPIMKTTVPDPSHAHTVRRYKVGNEYRWAVLGPDGYYRDGYHKQEEADAAAAFLSGDMKAAEEHRKAFLMKRGLITEE